MRLSVIKCATNSSGMVAADDEIKFDGYELEDIYKSVEAEIAADFQSMNWNSDDSNIYLDVTDDSDKVVQFKIPLSDLSNNKLADNVSYIVDEVKATMKNDVNSSVKAPQLQNVKPSGVTSAQYPDGTEYDPEDYEGGYTEWEKVVSKPVRDSDGFMTEYTMWFNNFDGRYVFIFGDPDIYYPENADFDWECEDYDEAVEWWNDYNGFEDDEIEECSSITSSMRRDNPVEWIDATEIVRKMYNKFPDAKFIDERDLPDNKVALYFKLGKSFVAMEDYLKRIGVDYVISNGKVRIIAPEDSEYSITSAVQLNPKAAMKICDAAWGDKAVRVALNCLSDKLEGYDDYDEFFDVSYIGTTKELRDELFEVFKAAGVNPKKESDNEIEYDNEGMIVSIKIIQDDDASTYSEDSVGYFIYVDNIDSGGYYDDNYDDDDDTFASTSIKSSTNGEMPYVVRFGWDSGGPENGPSYGYGEDIVYALSEEDACKKWEAENQEQIEGFNSSKYGGYEGCFAHLATEDDIKKFEEDQGSWDELERMYDFSDEGVTTEGSSIKTSEEFFDKGEDSTYWYFTTHGVMPGSVPKGLTILDIVDKPEGSYFLTDKVLTTDALKYYDIKERAPKGVTSSKDIKAWYVGDPATPPYYSAEPREIDYDKLWEIAERYNTSKPVSGDWSTETAHEQQAIADELNISPAKAKKLMIDELGFDESMF